MNIQLSDIIKYDGNISALILDQVKAIETAPGEEAVIELTPVEDQLMMLITFRNEKGLLVLNEDGSIKMHKQPIPFDIQVPIVDVLNQLMNVPVIGNQVKRYLKKNGFDLQNELKQLPQ